MPRGVKKENLPSKVCVTCQRPFTWRKVWEKCWDEVQCCSDRCKAERKRKLQAANRERLRDPDPTLDPAGAADTGDVTLRGASSEPTPSAPTAAPAIRSPQLPAP